MVSYITDSKEIGLALNFGDYPVLMVDHDKPCYEGSTYCVGSRVRVWYRPASPMLAFRETDTAMLTRGNVFYENGQLGISAHGYALKADFGYSDVIEDAEWAQAVTVEEGQTVVVVEQWSERRRCTVRKMKVPENIDPFCQVVGWLQEIEG